jgi:hypothetical protein
LGSTWHSFRVGVTVSVEVPFNSGADGVAPGCALDALLPVTWMLDDDGLREFR